jgi:O-antigen/teichoic acid export membrane protein
MVKHIFIYLLGIVLPYFASFLLVPLYARHLTPAEFGLLEIINISVDVAIIIFSAGLGIATLSLYSKEVDVGKKRKVISTALILAVVSSTLGVLFFEVFAPGIHRFFFKSAAHLNLLRAAGLLLLSQNILAVPMAFIQAQINSKLYVTIVSIQSLCIISLNILVIVGFDMRVGGIIFSNILVSSTLGLILIVWVIKRTGISFDTEILRKLLSFGLPFIPSGLCLFILNVGDRFFIQRILDAREVGIYSLGYKIGSIVAMIVVGPFFKVWGPYLFKVDRNVGGREAFGKYLLYLTVVYCIVSLGVALFSKEIMQILSSKYYWEGYRVTPYVLLANLFFSVASFFDSGFYITQKTYFKPFIMASSAAVVFLLYYWLIPLFGILGAAYATTISFAVFVTLTFIFSNRVFPVKYDFRRLLITVVGGAVFYLLGDLFRWDSYLRDLCMRGGLFILYPLTLLSLRIIEKEELIAALAFVKKAKKKVFRITPGVAL